MEIHCTLFNCVYTKISNNSSVFSVFLHLYLSYLQITVTHTLINSWLIYYKKNYKKNIYKKR